jgi:Uma2 family endonuclease
VRTLLCTQQSRTLPRAAELPTTAAEPTFMGMPDILTPVYWTADMARHLPEDGNRYEVVYGELLVTPAPRLWHQQLVQRLSFTLAKYLEIHRAGVVLTSPADISWGRDVLVQPDVFVVPVEQARTLEWSAIRDLLLVAEVLSPSTPRHDRFTKRRRYQEAGVPLYWIGRRGATGGGLDAGRRLSALREGATDLAARGGRRPVHRFARGPVPADRVTAERLEIAGLRISSASPAS